MKIQEAIAEYISNRAKKVFCVHQWISDSKKINLEKSNEIFLCGKCGDGLMILQSITGCIETRIIKTH